ncbi:MAG: SDR family oxidoreductase [Chloroflexi bacterium]|nr:SDR family oxidoreductase [Chloroflexota bacterium]
MTMLDDQVVLITGAGRGVGAAIAKLFALQGATIAANDITPINLDKVVESIAATGAHAKSYVHDISKKMPVQALINAIINDWGRLDIVINAASVNPKSDILSLDAWDWQRALDVNLTGTFLVTQSAGRIMQGREGGTIINIAANYSSDHKAAYITSKTGIIGLTQESARELKPYNIRINAICSGCVVNTGELSNNSAQVQEALSQAALFLCSQEASQISGQIIDINDQDSWHTYTQ